MSLRASRRLPRAFQRPPSPFSRGVASRLVREGKKRRLRAHRFLRWWSKIGRTLRGGLRGLRTWCIALAGAALLTVLLLVLFSPLFQVGSIRVTREDRRIDIEELQRLLLPFFGKHLLFLSTNLVERTVRSAYPEVADVAIAKRPFHELHVTLVMDPIVADVRMGEPDATEHASSATGAALHSYLTSRGAFLVGTVRLEPKGGETRMQIHIVDWAARPTHRQRIVSEELLRDIRSAVNILTDSFGHTVSAVTLYLRAREFHVRTERLVLWFDTATPVVQQIDRYRAWLRTLPSESAEEYVDLRPHDRVVYR